ncbi:MAG: hypothetical protein ACREBC_36225, partial [Pyrinomonadaceae bacterium]
MLRSDQGRQFGELPLLGHIAIYTLNLVILRTVLDKKAFLFEESCYGGGKENGEWDTSETRAWDKLAYIWRSWFALDNLNGLTAILAARRDGGKVIVTARDPFQVIPSGDRLETVLNVASTLADNITAGLSELLFRDTGEEVPWQELGEIEKRLEAESIRLHFEMLVRRLRLFLLGGGKVGDGDKLVLNGLREALSLRERGMLRAEFCDLVTKALRLK